MAEHPRRHRVRASVNVYYTIDGASHAVAVRLDQQTDVRAFGVRADETARFARVPLQACVAAMCDADPRLLPSGDSDWVVKALHPAHTLRQRRAAQPRTPSAPSPALLAANPLLALLPSPAKPKQDKAWPSTPPAAPSSLAQRPPRTPSGPAPGRPQSKGIFDACGLLSVALEDPSGPSVTGVLRPIHEGETSDIESDESDSELAPFDHTHLSPATHASLRAKERSSSSPPPPEDSTPPSSLTSTHRNRWALDIVLRLERSELSRAALQRREQALCRARGKPLPQSSTRSRSKTISFPRSHLDGLDVDDEDPENDHEDSLSIPSPPSATSSPLSRLSRADSHGPSPAPKSDAQPDAAAQLLAQLDQLQNTSSGGQALSGLAKLLSQTLRGPGNTTDLLNALQAETSAPKPVPPSPRKVWTEFPPSVQEKAQKGAVHCVHCGRLEPGVGGMWQKVALPTIPTDTNEAKTYMAQFPPHLWPQFYGALASEGTYIACHRCGKAYKAWTEAGRPAPPPPTSHPQPEPVSGRKRRVAASSPPRSKKKRASALARGLGIKPRDAQTSPLCPRRSPRNKPSGTRSVINPYASALGSNPSPAARLLDDEPGGMTLTRGPRSGRSTPSERGASTPRQLGGEGQTPRPAPSSEQKWGKEKVDEPVAETPVGPFMGCTSPSTPRPKDWLASSPGSLLASMWNLSPGKEHQPQPASVEDAPSSTHPSPVTWADTLPASTPAMKELSAEDWSMLAACFPQQDFQWDLLQQPTNLTEVVASQGPSMDVAQDSAQVAAQGENDLAQLASWLNNQEGTAFAPNTPTALPAPSAPGGELSTVGEECAALPVSTPNPPTSSSSKREKEKRPMRRRPRPHSPHRKRTNKGRKRTSPPSLTSDGTSGNLPASSAETTGGPSAASTVQEDTPPALSEVNASLISMLTNANMQNMILNWAEGHA